MDQINEFQRCLEALPLTKSVTSRPIVKHSIEFELIYLGNPDSLQVDVMKKAREFRLRRLGACGTKNGQLVFSYM